MLAPFVISLPHTHLELTSLPPGARVLAGLLRMAQHSVAALHTEMHQRGCRRMAVLGRLRGTGRGIHFRDFVEELETTYPIRLQAPFEDSMKVAGAAWSDVVLPDCHGGALAKLRWEAGADDLPMHVHEHSDRFIIVLEGRGFFHVSGQTVDAFDGRDVRSVPARERDVFLFTRDVVHTFSTLREPMTLLSCQLPFLPFDDPRQYRLPAYRWTARDHADVSPPSVAVDPAWTGLAAS